MVETDFNEKFCVRCEKVKNLSEFRKEATGYSILCKMCMKEIYLLERKAKFNYGVGVPLKKRKRARSLAACALKSGKLVKPSSCENCGKETLELEMHHWNYDFPLRVTFVCGSCHHLWHERYKMIDGLISELYYTNGKERP